MLYAHTPNAEGAWHPLGDHLRAVAELAASHAAFFGGTDLARWTGGWHDVGKASEDFQAYLAACAREPGRRFQTVDHKGAGILEAGRVCEPLAFLVDGHHGGLRDQGDVGTRLKELGDAQGGAAARAARERAANAGLIPTEVAFADDLPFPSFVRDERSLELFLRFLFSALVDADFLDTEAHWQPDAGARRQTVVDLETLASRLEAAQDRLSGREGDPVNAARHEVYEASRRAAVLPPGFFRLTVPTGGGKTRSVLAFALRHALAHDLRRVIVVSPYLTISDQTADVFRDVLGDDRVVLEHHSDAGRHDDPEGPPTPEAVWRRLAAQNWDSPVIVTTAVQFFESLFGRLTTVCRKVHRIARSVVVLDEAQTLPPHLLAPILDVLKELVAHYGVSVVLCTATQPAFAHAPGFEDLPEVREIAPDPPRLFRILKRVTYEWPALTERWDWSRAAATLREEPQALAIVNTKNDALALLDELDDADALHLSTFLCAAHRRDVLARVRAKLRRGDSCRVVSTQVVEAGVDIDFPFVLRAVGPLDRIVQAAGRCNREGKLPSGRVVVFDPEAGRQPQGAYRTGGDVTWTMLRKGDVDPDDPVTFERYFARLFGSVSLDSEGVQALRAGLNYERVAAKFRLIQDDTVSVFVRYRGISEVGGGDVPRVDHESIVARLLRELEVSGARPGGASVRSLLARAQPYLVAMPRRAIGRLETNGLVSPLIGEVWLWKGGYDEVRGIGRLEGSGLEAADLVV
jgi:CRISPR-associated endonuclease/helicase Cas3